MLRITLLLLCLILAGAAAGRYKAEAAVRETRRELRNLDQQKSEEIARIQVLRAEVAYLESPERLASIADKATNLEPLTGDQLLTADDFLFAFGAGMPARAAENAPVTEKLEVAQSDAPAGAGLR